MHNKPNSCFWPQNNKTSHKTTTLNNVLLVIYASQVILNSFEVLLQQAVINDTLQVRREVFCMGFMSVPDAKPPKL